MPDEDDADADADPLGKAAAACDALIADRMARLDRSILAAGERLEDLANLRDALALMLWQWRRETLDQIGAKLRSAAPSVH